MLDSVQFPDAKSGEWFGYLTQEGKVALDFKGGPFKGKNIFLRRRIDWMPKQQKNLSNDVDEKPGETQVSLKVQNV